MIRHHFYALDSVSIVFFIGVTKSSVSGHGKLDIMAQVLAECAACNYANIQSQQWVPILAILCDGEKFDFHGVRKIHLLVRIHTGLVGKAGKSGLFLLSLKETAE